MPGFFNRIRRAIARTFQRRSLADREWFRGIAGGKALCGVEVNEETAIGEVTIFACVRAISGTVASLPRGVFRRLDPTGKEKLRKHPVARVARRPNEWMNEFAFWAAIAARVAFYGEAYAQIIREVGTGRLLELWPLPLDTRPVSGPGGKLFYEFTVGAEKRQLSSDKVLHVRGLSFDGVTSLRPIRVAAEAVGLALAAERFAAKFFGNGSNLSGVLIHPGDLTPQAKQQIKKDWKELYSGVDNSHDVAVIDEGLKYEKIGTEPEKAQLDETRNNAAVRMCQLLNVPPCIVGLLENANYATAEQQSLVFAQNTIRPLLEAIESECDAKLFTEAEQDDECYLEHNMDALLRGDFKTRMEAWGTSIQNGIYCVDEVRDRENENPLPDGKGTDYFHQVNLAAVPPGGMAAAQQAARESALKAEPDVPSDPTPADTPAV